MRQNAVKIGAALVDHRREADDLGARADDDQQLQSAVAPELHRAVIRFHFHCLYLLKKSVGMAWVKLLVYPHQGHQILRVGQIDDVVGITGQHMNRLDLLTRNVKAEHLVAADSALLNAPATGHHDEELPLGIMPVLPLGDAGL